MRSLAIAAVGLASALALSITEAATYTSDVTVVTSSNWKSEVLDSPHLVFLNVCRDGCGYCQRLAPEFQKLANELKHQVKVAYWDTAHGNPPSLVGPIKGTPTLKVLYPSKKNKKRSNRDKVVLDYQQAREAGPMRDFAVSRMPSFVQRLKKEQDLDAFLAKADKYNLPKIILFNAKGPLKSVYKAISTEFRRRVLVGVVQATAIDADKIRDRVGVKKFPALVAMAPGEGGGVVGKFKKKASWNALNSFFFDYSLPKPYFDMPKPDKESSDSSSHGEL